MMAIATNSSTIVNPREYLPIGKATYARADYIADCAVVMVKNFGERVTYYPTVYFYAPHNFHPCGNYSGGVGRTPRDEHTNDKAHHEREC